MKILVDTNVIISAIVFGGQPALLLDKLFKYEHELYVSTYIDKEVYAILTKKWPDKALLLYSSFRKLNFIFCPSADKTLGALRDEKDVQVLSDAIYYNVDLILSGDKDFLEAELTTPLVYSPAMLLAFLEKNAK